jgi:hypothetical protein
MVIGMLYYRTSALVLQAVPDVVTDTGSRIVDPLAEAHPFLGVIATIGVAVVGYLGWQLHRKEAELKELNSYVRENDRENLKTIQGLATMIEKLTDVSARIPGDVRRDLDATAEKLLVNLSSLIERIRNHG